MLKTWHLKCKGTPIYIKQRSKKLNATDYRRSLTISTRLVNSYSTRKCDNCKGANFSHLSKSLLDLKCNCAFQATMKSQYVFPTRLFKKNVPLIHHLGRHRKESGSTRNSLALTQCDRVKYWWNSPDAVCRLYAPKALPLRCSLPALMWQIKRKNQEDNFLLNVESTRTLSSNKVSITNTLEWARKWNHGTCTCRYQEKMIRFPCSVMIPDVDNR